MKKIIRGFKYTLIFLLWLLYALITIERRNRYMYGKSKGMQCIDVKDRFMYTDLAFDPNQKPTRDYLTFKEFFEVHKNWINK